MALIEAPHDPDFKLCLDAADGLRESSSNEVIQSLIALLKRGSEGRESLEDRESLRDILKNVTGKDCGINPGKWEEWQSTKSK